MFLLPQRQLLWIYQALLRDICPNMRKIVNPTIIVPCTIAAEMNLLVHITFLMAFSIINYR